MLVHLQYKHKEEYTAVTSKATLDTGALSRSAQRLITAVFQQLSPISHSSSGWKALTDSVCFCIAKDMLPYDAVTDPGFRHMLHMFEPRYVPPDRTTIARHYMPLLYEREKAKVTSTMASGLQHFAITSDGWSSQANHSYVSLTVHYINQQWETCYHLLETAESTTDNTAVNLATGLEEVLARWQLPLSKLSGATTDNARNITAALEILGWQQLGCFAHTLQLGVHKAMALPEMIRALGRAKRLVGHFHHSVKSTNVLHQKQKDLRHDEQHLIQTSYIHATVQLHTYLSHSIQCNVYYLTVNNFPFLIFIVFLSSLM